MAECQAKLYHRQRDLEHLVAFHLGVNADRVRTGAPQEWRAGTFNAVHERACRPISYNAHPGLDLGGRENLRGSGEDLTGRVCSSHDDVKLVDRGLGPSAAAASRGVGLTWWESWSRCK